MSEQVIRLVDAGFEDLAINAPPAEQIEVRWQTAKFEGLAGLKTVNFTVLLSDPLPVAVEIPVSLGDGTDAVVGDDYVEVTGDSITFPSGTTVRQYQISIPDTAKTGRVLELVLEEAEVEDAEGNTYVVTPHASRDLFTVDFYDVPTSVPVGFVYFQWEVADITFEEGQQPPVTRARLLFSDPVPADALVRVYTDDGTATQYNDYIPQDRLVDVPAGVTELAIDVEIIDDGDTPAESLENFTLTVERVAGPIYLASDGECTIGIAADPVPLPPVLRWSVLNLSVTEGGLAVAAIVQLAAHAEANTFIPVEQTGDFARLSMQWPGGTAGVIRILQGQNSALVRLTCPVVLGNQGTTFATFRLLPGSGYTLSGNETLVVQINDNGQLVPSAIRWDSGASFTIFESSLAGPIEVTRNLVVHDPTGSDVSQERTVHLTFAGTATPGSTNDYQCTSHPTGIVTFAPNQTSVPVTLRRVDDGVAEPNETITVTIDNPVNCTIGDIPTIEGTIVDDDGSGAGDDLRPQFYFTSEVFGQGPNHDLASDVAPLVVDLGRVWGGAVSVDVTFQVWTHNATENTHFAFGTPDTRTVTIAPGNRRGFLNVDCSGGIAAGQRRVVVELTGTSHGQLGRNTRWTGIMLGSSDTRGLYSIPTKPTTDFEVYANRIEDLVHGLTIPLPLNWNSNAGDMPAVRATYEPVFGNLNDPDTTRNRNGMGIAAKLAGKVWLDRNGSFANVKWLQEGTPVCVEVKEAMAVKPSLFFGEGAFESPGNGAVWCDSIRWTRASGGWVRDLWIVGSAGVEINELNFRWKHDGSGNTRVQLDNVHLKGFAVAKTNGTGDQCWSQSRGAPNNPHPSTFDGVIYLDQVVFKHDSSGALPPAGQITTGSYWCNMRINHPASWVITRCTFATAREHSVYLNSPGPITVFAQNTLPDPGTGRTMFQAVNRPQEYSVPGSGLMVIADNVCWGNAVLHGVGDGGQNFDVYSGLYYIFVEGNTHRGRLQSPGTGQPTNVRRLHAYISTGNLQGIYAFEYPFGSGDYYAFRYVRIDDEVHNLQAGDSWQNNPIAVSGACFLELGAEASYSGPNVGSRPWIDFNLNPYPGYDSLDPNLNNNEGAQVRDPLETVVGSRTNRINVPNRDGGVSFIAPFVGSSLGVAASSTTKARHYTHASGYFAAQNFNAFSTGVQDAYDGGDLA